MLLWESIRDMLLDETRDPQNSGHVILACTCVHGLREKVDGLKTQR